MFRAFQFYRNARKDSSHEVMNTSVEDLNDSQYETLKQFKKNIADVLPADYSDVWLIKWLRSHSYNLRKTEVLFRGAMRTREVYELDTIVSAYVKPEVVSKYEFSSFMGIAKNGSPVRYSRLGVSGDYMGFLMSLTAYEVVLYCTYLMEHDLAVLKKENERSGRRVHEVTYVIDMEGFAVHQLLHRSAIEMALDMLQMMQDHYPELWGNIFIVNAPSYFDKFFNIFKPILRLNMLQKIRVTSRDSTPAVLLKFIDENVLPAFLGGKRTDSSGDPKCSEFINFGGKVPRDYFLRNRAPLLLSDPGVTSVWVSPRSVFNHSVVVRRKNSWMRLEIRTENGSVGLKMLFRPFGNDPDNLDLPACDEYLDDGNPSSKVIYVSPNLRIQSHFSPVDETVRAPWPGIYIFRFDNTYSWFTSRKIIYRIRLLQESI